MRRAGALLLLLAAAGCGGSEDDYPATPRAVAERFVSTNAAEKCDLLAQGLVESQTQQQGQAARDACARNVVRFPAAGKVTFREVEEAGDEAAVELVADGQEAAVSLRRIEGRWRIVGFAE